MIIIGACLLLGIITGISSGLLGIGGGIIMVPIFRIMLQLDQKQATATSLVAMLLPVGILAIYRFHQSGIINKTHIQYGLVTAIGIFIGAYFGAMISISIPTQTLSKLFGVFLLIYGVKLITFSN